MSLDSLEQIDERELNCAVEVFCDILNFDEKTCIELDLKIILKAYLTKPGIRKKIKSILVKQGL